MMYAAVLPIAFLSPSETVSMHSVIGAWSVSTLVAGTSAWLLALNKARSHSQKDGPAINETRWVLRTSLKGFLGTASPIENLRLDQLLVALTFSPYILGIYVVSLAFVNVPRWISHSFGISLVPHIAGMPDIRVARRDILKAAAVSFGMNLFIGGCLVLSMPFLVDLLFGEQFRPSIATSQILIVGAVVLAVRRVLSDGLRAMGRGVVSTWAELATYLCLGVAWLPCTKSYGLEGAAFALALAHAVGLLVTTYFLLRLYEPTQFE
jgi:O-antigen/teichoic acid export membrane protein